MVTDIKPKPEIRKRLEFVERKKPLLESKGFFSGTRIQDEVERFYGIWRTPFRTYRGVPIGGKYGNQTYDESKRGTIPQDLVEIVSDYREAELPTNELVYERIKEAFNYPLPKGQRLRLRLHFGSMVAGIVGPLGTIHNLHESNFGAAVLWGMLGVAGVYGFAKSGVNILKARSEAAKIHEEKNKDVFNAYYSLLHNAGEIDEGIANYKQFIQNNG